MASDSAGDGGSPLGTALADRYRIERELGAGGMATVYLARDLRHDRDVAIKVLHPELAAALGGDRFLSEIKTTARLQHPHILPLLDSGSADGLLYYVMPYVTGDTLRARLERERQLPMDDALRIAREVADALGSAHALGIVHRDIKPENILLQGGHALVADFGIALAVQSAGGARMTQTGLSLGTPQYMSPEQAMGERVIDARSDLYSLGAVLYEMLTGDPPFSGNSVQAIVAKVLSERPTPVSTLRDTVPTGVERAVLTALAKLPADRYATAAAFIAARGEGGGVSEASGAASAPGRAASARERRWLQVAVAANVVMAAGIAVVMLRPAPAPLPSRHQVVLWKHSLPDPFLPGAMFVSTQAAIAPDGSSIVYADSADGWTLLRKRRESSVAEPLAGTKGGVSPFFSPDGKWIGFVTVDGKIRKIPTAGGSPITVADGDLTDYKVAAWLDDGSIVFSGAKLRRVPATGGGAPRALRMPLELNDAFMAINPLPGSRGFVFTGCRGNCAFASDAYVYDFAADSARLILPGATGAWYAPTGHILFTGRDGGLFAATFNARTLTLGAESVPVIDGVVPGSVTLSTSGTMLYALDLAALDPSELVWVDRQGRATPVDSTWRGRFDYPAISPDGRSVAVSVRDKSTDLWVRRADGARLRVNAPGTVNWRPSWAPDSRSLTFVSIGASGFRSDVTIHRVSADAGAASTLLFRYKNPVYEAELSPDSQWIVFRSDEPDGGSNIHARRLRGDTAAVPLAVGDGSQMQPTISPNGKWLAYSGDQQGVREVFLISFPDGKNRRLVSRGGGSEPRWARSGRELFFESRGRLVVVTIGAGSEPAVTEPVPLFGLGGYRRARNRPEYDVAPGDQRFLMIKEPPAPPVPTVIHVEQWFPELLGKIRP